MTQTTTTARPDADTRVAAARALEAGVGHLRRRQDPQGWWKGELETNVTMDAEDVLLREFLGVRDARRTEETARWIRSQQRADGTWATYAGGPGDLSTTVEAWIALRLAGDPADAPHLRRAAAFVGPRAGSRRPGSSPASGAPWSVCGPGTTCPRCRPS